MSDVIVRRANDGALSPVEQEAARICAELIRIETINTGDDGSTGEREAAEHVMALLTEVGYEPIYLESRPKRGTVILRVEGEDSQRDPLIVHGHLDVVGAVEKDWQVGPWSGEVLDGCIWGRGAVDMKDMDAMVIAILRDMRRSGWKPARDLIIAFFADEEAGGKLGAHWIVDHHPGLLGGAKEAIGEVGGFSTVINGQRAYLLQTAEKGLMWLRLLARGTAGHGSAVNPDNAVAHLVEALSRLKAYEWPLHLTPTTTALLQGVADLTGLPYAQDRESLDALLDVLGPTSRFAAPTLATTVNPTVLSAGDKVNVVPGTASAQVDIRFMPETEAEVRAVVDRLVGPRLEVDPIHQDWGVASPLAHPLVDAMTAALLREDPDAIVLPYMLCAGTDAKSLSQLGITCYGFVPLKLPANLDFTAMFHGVDERVPLDALGFGTRVLADFLATC